MMDRVGVVESEALSIAFVIFICHAVGDGAGPGKAYFWDALGVFPRKQELVQNHRLLMLDFTDDARSVLLRSSGAHRNRFEVDSVNSAQLIDDMQNVVAAPFLTVGNDVDARAVLVFD